LLLALPPTGVTLLCGEVSPQVHHHPIYLHLFIYL
jgi:hypothetical protein